ncbi:MAG: Hint domain-containing protein [Pseudomonadota bacterium]
MKLPADRSPGPSGLIAGFAPGTRIRCGNKLCRVEMLRAGDLVSTMANGERPITSVERHDHAGSQLTPALLPIRIERDTFGGGFPRRDLTLSPRHRLLVRGARLALMSGQAGGLVPAVTLLGTQGVRRLDRSEVSYIQLLFDAPEIIFANGWGTESLCAADAMP